MKTHDIGRIFWHSIRVQPDAPFHHRSLTHELEAPYRTSNSHVFRLRSDGRGIVVGVWSKTGQDEAVALMGAISTHTEDIEFFDDERTYDLGRPGSIRTAVGRSASAGPQPGVDDPGDAGLDEYELVGW